MRHKRVGILSMYYHNRNYGGQLQAYALNRAVMLLGWESEQLCFDNSMLLYKVIQRLKLAKKIPLRESLLQYYHRLLGNRIGDAQENKLLNDFEIDQIQHSSKIYNRKNIHKSMESYDVFLCGSDQIWNAVMHHIQILKIYGLLFVRGQHKSAYAASMGAIEPLSAKQIRVFSQILNSLDNISVRESSAKELLQAYCKKEIKVVLDPTLLLERDEWNEVAVLPEIHQPYALGYFLSSGPTLCEQAEKIAAQLSLKMYCGPNTNNHFSRQEFYFNDIPAGPAEFVGLIKHADYVLTDSFHGMVFSIIYEKLFYVFKRHKDDEYGSMNTRITDLLQELGLTGRLLDKNDIPQVCEMKKAIDYSKVYSILSKKRDDSLQFLEESLNILN